MTSKSGTKRSRRLKHLVRVFFKIPKNNSFKRWDKLLFLPQSWKWKMGPSNISLSTSMIVGERVPIDDVTTSKNGEDDVFFFLFFCLFLCIDPDE